MAMIDSININIEIAQHTSNLTLETNFLSSLSPIVAAVLEVELGGDEAGVFGSESNPCCT